MKSSQSRAFADAAPVFAAAIFLLTVSTGCCPRWCREDPPPMYTPPEIQHPVKAANDIEFRLQTQTDLIDAPEDTVVHFDPDGDWEHPLFAPIWQALLPRLLQRYPRLDFVIGTKPPGCTYQLTVKVETASPFPTATLRLRNPETDKELWSYSHPLPKPTPSTPTPQPKLSP